MEPNEFTADGLDSGQNNFLQTNTDDQLPTVEQHGGLAFRTSHSQIASRLRAAVARRRLRVPVARPCHPHRPRMSSQGTPLILVQLIPGSRNQQVLRKSSMIQSPHFGPA